MIYNHKNKDIRKEIPLIESEAFTCESKLQRPRNELAASRSVLQMRLRSRGRWSPRGSLCADEGPDALGTRHPGPRWAARAIGEQEGPGAVSSRASDAGPGAASPVLTGQFRDHGRRRATGGTSRVF